jgi:colanic acid/amylovoran biosynthesis glycosyltransferase
VNPKVLHAVDEFGCRSETFVYTVVSHHQQFEASVLCHSRANPDEFPFPRVHVVPRATSRRTMEWWLAASIERAGGRTAWRRRVETLLATLAPDVVHAHFGPIGCELVSITTAMRIPLVTSLYGVDAAVLPHLPQWRKRYARLFENGELFLAEGPEMRRKIIAAGAPVSRTELQPIAIDLDKYPRWSPDARSMVLFVGRFVEKKGLLDAIEAFARARPRVGGARFVVIGSGPEEPAARKAVARLGLADAVEFAGMRSHREVIAHLRAAHALIHPSATAEDGDSEGGAPTILLEAQAIGTPIVTTRHADIPNVLPEGPGVYLCEEHDVDKLGDALASALAEGQAVGAAYVRSHHDVRRAVPALEHGYQRIIRARAHAAMV